MSDVVRIHTSLQSNYRATLISMMNRLSLLLLLSFGFGCLSFQLSTRPSQRSPATAAFARAKSKWDDLVDDDEEDLDDSIPVAPGAYCYWNQLKWDYKVEANVYFLH